MRREKKQAEQATGGHSAKETFLGAAAQKKNKKTCQGVPWGLIGQEDLEKRMTKITRTKKREDHWGKREWSVPFIKWGIQERERNTQVMQGISRQVVANGGEIAPGGGRQTPDAGPSPLRIEREEETTV